jgi:glycosyltransferase involved in cell wall biosynthesis
MEGYMKNIAFFTENLKVGGIQKSIINLLNNLDFSKFNVDLYLFDKNVFFENQLPKEVNIIFLKKSCFINKFIPFKFLYYFKKSSALKDKLYDVAIDFDSYQFDTALNTLKSGAKKKVIWIHNDVKKEYKYQFKYRVLYHFMKSKYKYFDEFVGVSEGVIEPFREMNNILDDSFFVIPNFIDTEKIIEKSKEKTSLMIDSKKYNFVSVGRLCYQKGFDILLKDILALTYLRQDFHLYIIGDGKCKKNLIKYVSDNNLDEYVSFLGSKTNPYKYMSNMDGFVLTSRFEGQGMVFLEAKTLGLDIFIPKELVKYTGCNIVGCDNIVDALSNASKNKKHKIDYLMSYNKKIKNGINLLLTTPKKNVENRKKKNIDSIIFIVVLFIMSLLILGKICCNSNIYNIFENRSSYKFEIPKFSDILNGEFQENLELVIADQMPKYDVLKSAYFNVYNFINIEAIYIFKLNEISKYIHLGNGINLYNDYLLYNNTTNEGFNNTAKDDVEKINSIYSNTNANLYVYFIETDSNYNFETSYKVDAYDYLTSNLIIDKNNIGVFSINDFSDYEGFFYKTDHHWNHKGANKGYLEISQLMHLDDTLMYKEEICYDNIKSTGSKTRSLGGNKIFSETACEYIYDFPKFEITVGDVKLDDYGNSVESLEKMSSISYASIYGSDYKEIIFKNPNNKNGKKLLVYANSFSNAINKLLASSYFETYVIDGRYYENFDIIDYINENEIDDVLILANCMLFWDDIDW